MKPIALFLMVLALSFARRGPHHHASTGAQHDTSFYLFVLPAKDLLRYAVLNQNLLN
jgi:hypothetical protein